MGVPNKIIKCKNWSEVVEKIKKYDIIHVHHSPENLLAALLKKRYKFKLIHTWHGVIPPKYTENFTLKSKLLFALLSHKFAFNFCDKIISVSRFLQAQVKNSCYIPNGVDTSIFKPKKIEHESFTVLYVGAMEKFRGVHLIPQFAKKLPQIKFLLVGKGSVNFNLLNINNIEKKNYTSYKEIIKFYNSSDLMIRPSLYEGFGIPVLEAMACELPVIASDFPCFKEIISEGTGFCVSLNKFPEYILYFFDNPKEVKRYGRRARRQAKKFEWKKIAKQTFKVYEEVLD
ncbi:MAG: glycosyltransferase family 4 protein [Candidatus Aenigmatarchaeota archaeon]